MTGAYAQIVRALGSETMLALVALGVLALDLVVGRKREMAKRREMVGAAALMGLALAAVPLIWQMGLSGVPLLGETLVVKLGAAEDGRAARIEINDHIHVEFFSL